MDRYYTLKQATHLLDISDAEIARYVEEGRLNPFLPPRHRIPKVLHEEVRAILREDVIAKYMNRFYTLKQAAKRLQTSDAEIARYVEEGRLNPFLPPRHRIPKVLYKEVHAIWREDFIAKYDVLIDADGSRPTRFPCAWAFMVEILEAGTWLEDTQFGWVDWPKQTVNVAELWAIYEGLVAVRPLAPRRVFAVSDSSYAIGTLSGEFQAFKNRDVLQLIWDETKHHHWVKFGRGPRPAYRAGNHAHPGTWPTSERIPIPNGPRPLELRPGPSETSRWRGRKQSRSTRGPI